MCVDLHVCVHHFAQVRLPHGYANQRRVLTVEEPHVGPQPEADAAVHEGPGIPHTHGGQVAPGILYRGCHSNSERVRWKCPAMMVVP